MYYNKIYFSQIKYLLILLSFFLPLEKTLWVQKKNGKPQRQNEIQWQIGKHNRPKSTIVNKKTEQQIKILQQIKQHNSKWITNLLEDKKIQLQIKNPWDK